MIGGRPEARSAPRAERAARVRALRGVEAVVLVATDLEAAPVVAAMSSTRSLVVPGGHWVCGRLAGARVVVVVGGYDKTNTAHALTLLVESGRPPLVLQVGIAGAYPGSGLTPGDLVLAAEEIYGDTGSSLSGAGWMPADGFGLPLLSVAGEALFNRLPLDPLLVEAARVRVADAVWGELRPRIGVGRCLTLSCVTGTASEARALAGRWGALAESMEGAAAAHVCLLHRVPFLEVRGVSNSVGDRRREGWDVTGAALQAARAAAFLCTDVGGLLSAASPPSAVGTDD